jgi:hypothetical protein
MFKKRKCEKCLKKDILFDCKCGKNFCLEHLKWYEHSCKYNFKDEKKQNLIDNNPKIVSSKIEKL